MARRKKTNEKARELQVQAEVDVLRDYKEGSVEYHVARFFYLLRSNLRSVLLVLGTVALCGAGALGFWAYLVTLEQSSLEAFDTLQKNPVMQASTDQARVLALEKLTEYEKNYPLLDTARTRASLKKIEILTAAGKSEEAAVVSLELARTLELPELRTFFYLKAAVLFENAGKYAQALEGYERSVELILVTNEVKAFALFGQGRCLSLLGRDRDARDAMENLLELEGEGDLAKYRLQAAAFLVSHRAR